MNSNSATRWTLKGLLSVFAALLLVFAFTSMLWAQAETGSIAGTVFDPSNAVVPKAKVTVRNVATGAERTTATGDNGDYTVTNLLPGVYAVTVEPAGGGLAKTEQQIEITVGTKVGLDFHLTLGSAPVTTVEVKASAGVAVNVENQTMETVVSPKQLLELPTLNTDPYSLVRISGNVSEDSPANLSGTGMGAGVAINGLRAAGTNVLLDGAANNDEFVGTTGQPVPLDSVQEYTVLTNNFTAEFGRASSGVVNVATKSGSNAFHGSAYEFNRVSALAANDYNDKAFGVTKPVYVRNQFGFSVGGPIIKNKLFFFEDTEWTRIRSSAVVINLIPDSALIAASNANTQSFFSSFGALRSGLTTIRTFNRPQLAAAGADPCAGTTTCAALFSPTSTTPMFDEVTYNVPSDSGAGAPQNTYDLVARVDQNLSSRTQLYYRFARYHELDATGVVVNSPYAGYDTPQTVIDDNALVSMVHQIGTRWTTQTKFVYNRVSLVQPLGKNPVSPTLYFNSGSAASLDGILVSLPGYSQLFPGNAVPFGGPQNFFQTYEDISYVKGAHTFRFGGSYVFFQDNRTFGAYEEAVEGLGTTGGVNGSRMDNLLNGQLAIFEAAVNPQGKLPCPTTAPEGGMTVVTPACTVNLPVGPPNFSRSNRYHEFAFYGQDSWKVSPRVTINLGLRWEYYGIQHDKNPLLDSNFYEGSGASYYQRFRNGGVAIANQSPVGGLWAKDWHDFAPRLGFAWDIFGNGKWSFRGGYGIAYERNYGNVTFNVIQNPPAYFVISIQPADVGPIPITTSNAGPLAGTSGSKALPKASLRNVDENIRTAYAHLYSAALEHEVWHNVVAALEYSGSKGQNLYSLNPNNRLGTGNFYLGDPCTPAAGNCSQRAVFSQFSTINVRENLGVSNYNALNARVQVNNVANSGVNLLANYTWSKALDNISQTFTGAGNDLNLGLTDSTNPLLDRGPADFDNRHRIIVSGIWDIPFAKNTHGWMKQVLDGWSVAPIFTARSGFGFTVYDCTNTEFQQCPRLQVNGAFPRGAHGTKPIDAITGTPNEFGLLNLGALSLSEFTSPITGNSDFGPYPANMTGRGIFQTPGFIGFDAGVHKWFFLTERFKLEMRFDMFNAFNHPNLFLSAGTAEASSTPAQFIVGCRGNCNGLVTQHRNIQLGARLTF